MSEMPPKFCLGGYSHVPPGDWSCVCPGTDVTVSGGHFGELVEKCEKLLVSMGRVPSVNFYKEVENAICERVKGWPHCIPCNKVAQSVNFMSIVRWVRAMYSFVTAHGMRTVAQEEAEHRARICAACPMQVATSGCWGCKGIAGLLPTLAGARTTSYDSQLKACGVCGCFNAVAVHMPVDMQGGEQLEFPTHCWKKSTQTQSE